MEIKSIKQYIPYNQNIHTAIKSLRHDKPHSHEFIEIFYVLSGSCDHSVAGEIVRLHSGDAYILFPGEVHNHIREGMSSDFMYRDILIMPSYFKNLCQSYYQDLYGEFLQNKIQKNILFTNNELFLLENLFVKYSNTTGPKNDTVTNLIIHNLISSFINQTLLKESNRYPNWLLTLISELDRPLNFTTPPHELIGSFHYSKPYICNTFKKYVGTTITEYFNKNRITYAHSLVSTTDHTIEEICEMAGFSNISYFYMLYKKYYGKTPRNSHKSTPPPMKRSRFPIGCAGALLFIGLRDRAFFFAAFRFLKRLPPVRNRRAAIFLNSNADIRFALNLLLRNRFGFRAKRAEPRFGPAP